VALALGSQFVQCMCPCYTGTRLGAGIVEWQSERLTPNSCPTGRPGPASTYDIKVWRCGPAEVPATGAAVAPQHVCAGRDQRNWSTD
jgi:hypothetical protein